jgi:hypothetical protein
MSQSRRNFLCLAGGAASGLMLGCKQPLASPSNSTQAGERGTDATVQAPGIQIINGPLSARFLDNTPQYIYPLDMVVPGMNGLFSLKHAGQNKNIFVCAGMNYETCEVLPPAGKRHKQWNAPRLAPMSMEQTGRYSVRFSQQGVEASGLNIQIDFAVGETHIDQTITTWPDQDIQSSKALWASYMNNVQNTSIYLRGLVDGESTPRWLEVARVGTRIPGNMWRNFDPAGKSWDQHLIDNPVRRQCIIDETPEAIAAAKAAGFQTKPFRWLDQFFYGLVDEYLFLIVLGEPLFELFYSPSGGAAKRLPAWDYSFNSGPQKVGEHRVYHVRLVYKPFAGVEDVLREVMDFHQPPGHGAGEGANSSR